MIEFTLNGQPVSLDIDSETPLLEALRNDLNSMGPNLAVAWRNVAHVQYLLRAVLHAHV